ncbi:MAG: VanZ family protein [Acidobacteriota bacterium]
MKYNIPKIFFFLPSLFYYGLIFFLSSQSYQVKVDILFYDKLIHFIEFGILGFLLSLGFFVVNVSFKKKFIWVLFIGFVLALFDEIHQYFVPLRELEVFDLTADVIGVIGGFFIFTYFCKKTNLTYS